MHNFEYIILWHGSAFSYLGKIDNMALRIWQIQGFFKNALINLQD